MLILDTDHFSEFVRSGEPGLRLKSRLEATPDDATISIVTVEESNRGRLAKINKARSAGERLVAYGALQELTAALQHWDVSPWTSAADSTFVQLLSSKLRIGTMDLRIAAIVLANDAKLLSRNLRDFERVRDLKVENWLDD